MLVSSSSHLLILFLVSFAVSVSSVSVRRGTPLDITFDQSDETPTYLWPLPAEYTSGNEALDVDPALKLTVAGNGGGSAVLRAGFDRYRGIVFKHTGLGLGFSFMRKLRERLVSSVSAYDVDTLNITVHSDNEEVGAVVWNFLIWITSVHTVRVGDGLVNFNWVMTILFCFSLCSFNLEWMKAIPCWFPKPRTLPELQLRLAPLLDLDIRF